MELSALVDWQISADRRRGFEVDFDKDADRVAQLEKDLVGLIGEVGEFANALKKVRLTLMHPNYVGPTLATASQDMKEEIADIAIYLIRISAILGVDFEAAIIEKMRLNDIRYSGLK